jgi:type IV pilus assembly protein PilC
MSRKLALAYHNLSVTLEAGLPILKALNIIIEGQRGRLKRVFADLANFISKGHRLTEAMARHSSFFARIDVMLIEAAEESGNLADAFRMLSGWYEFCDRLKKRMLSGLVLPFVLIGVAAFVGPLPFFFQGKIGLDRYIGEAICTLAVVYLPFAFIIVVYYLIRRVVIFRRFFDAIIMRIPLFGQAIRQLAISRYCRAFNMLYKAGVPITQCAQKAADVTGNAVIGNYFRGGAKSALAGNMVGEGFSRRLPRDFLNLWQIGEETGELGNAVQKLADASGESAEFLFNELSKWLPRFVYWLVCVIMAFQIFRIAVFIAGMY